MNIFLKNSSWILSSFLMLVVTLFYYEHDSYWNQVLPDYYFFFTLAFSCIPLFFNRKQIVHLSILDLIVLGLILTTVLTRWIRIFPVFDIQCLTGIMGVGFYLLIRKYKPHKASFLYLMVLFCFVSFTMAIYGLGQYLEWIPGKNTLFPMTGTFPQPAAFANLVALLSFAILYFVQSRSKIMITISMIIWVVLVIIVYLSGTRIALLAMVLPLPILWARKISNQKIIIYSLIGVTFLIILVLSLSKGSDSLSGRILIWKISLLDFLEHSSFTGIGYGFFGEEYLSMQVDYFATSQFTTKEMLLASNSIEPFNELLRFIVENGYLGIILVVSFVIAIIIYRKELLPTSKEARILLAMFASFAIVSSMSYPLSFAFFKVLLLVLFAIYINYTNITLFIKLTRMYAIITPLFLITGSLFFAYNEYRTVLKWRSAWHDEYQKPQESLTIYKEIYPSLKRNGKFMEAYGAHLNLLDSFALSNQILKEAEKLYTSQTIYKLMAENHEQLGNLKNSESYLLKNIYTDPKLFVPKNELLQFYEKYEMLEKRKQLARKIINSPMKVSHPTSHKIKESALGIISNLQKCISN